MDENGLLLKRDDIAGGTGSRSVPRTSVARVAETPGLWEAILLPFRKAGPWAVLVLLMIVGIGYEAHLLIQGAGKNVAEYVEISGKNLLALLDSEKQGTLAHAQLQQALANVLNSTRDTRDQVLINTEKLTEIQQMLSQSIELLKAQPIGQEAQMASLKRIELAIVELNRLTVEGQKLEKEERAGFGSATKAPK